MTQPNTTATRSKVAKINREILEDFRTFFENLLSDHAGRKEASSVLVSWIQATFGGRKFHFCNTLKGTTAICVTGVMDELRRLYPDLSPHFLAKFQTQFIKTYGGCPIYIPKVSTRGGNNNAIIEAWKSGAPILQIASDFDYTDVWVRVIIRKYIMTQRSARSI